MKKYEEKPIPLIIRQEGKKYEVNPEALQFFASIEGKIAIISVAGVYRTGKSFLLNTILLNQKNGFAVGPTTNPKTKGIWVWGKPLSHRNEKDEIINVCVLDSEGLGSTEEDINHDLRLFSITLLLSSTFLYNTLGAIDQNAIDSLGLVLRLCEHLKSQNYNDFPDFHWILRDFSLALVGKDNNPLTTKMYLENCLSAQPGDSEVRNKIRLSIRSSFTNRSCSTFVRPLTDESCLQNLDKMELDELRPEFVEQVIEFRRNLFLNMKTKKIKGKEIKSELLNELIQIYVAQINGDKLPVIETGWKYVCKKECENVIESIEREADQIIAKVGENLPTTKKELQEEEEKIYQHLKKIFEAKTQNNDQAQFYLPSLSSIVHKKMKKLEEEMKAKNGQQTKNFIKKEFENIQKKLKQNEFKNMGELVKEFELFYEYYRKKCPYKDEIQTGLEYLMKKFSDCSLIMFKTMKNKKESEISKLKEELQKITSEFLVKEQKFKQQKTSTQDKNAVLESKIQELMKQNKSMADNVLELEQQLEKQKNQIEENRQNLNEQLELEMIAIRKKLMESEDNLKEAECQKMMELNNMKNLIMLKDNEVTHLVEQKNTVSEKLAAILLQFSNERSERQKKIDELLFQFEKHKADSEVSIKNLQEKIANKDSLISKLENSIESKSSELQNLIEQNEKQLKVLLQNFDHEKSQLTEGYKEQIRALKDTIQVNESDISLKVKKSEADFVQKEMDLKMHKLEIDKEKAILNQKIQFLKKDCEEKQEKITKILTQNNCYLSMFEEKDNDVSAMSNILEELKNTHENSTTEYSTKMEELSNLLSEKTKEINKLEVDIENYQNQIRQKNQEIKSFQEKLKSQTKICDEKLKNLNEKLAFEIENSEKAQTSYQNEIQALKLENTKNMQEQKRNAELSLVQLKNYYEMERQRLEKRILQDRKKHEYSESSTIVELENKHRKTVRSMQEEMTQLKSTIQSLEEQLVKVQNECELKIMNSEDQRENEKRISTSKYEVLEKKYEEICQEMAQFEKLNEDERINFVKRIESLNFDLTRKDKQLILANSKREAGQSTIAKKDIQIENIKKLMNQEIQASLKKVSDIQAKYQKLNEQYMQLKIESEKDIALSKQRNEFLNAKLNQLAKEKQIGSSKNLEKLDKQKITDLKDQSEKYKAELMSMESKLETNRKAMKDSDSNYKKQINNLEKENQFLNQKLEINESKISDLEAKIASKNEIIEKQLQDSREKNDLERAQYQSELETLREKLTIAEDQRSEASWKLQKEVALLNDRIKYAEYQRDQAKKQLEENEKRLQLAFAQLKKSSDKVNEENEAKKSLNDKKHISQLEVMKESMRIKNQEYEETIKKQRDELKTLKQKNIQLSQKLHRAQKAKNIEKSLLDENEILKKQKQNLMTNYRSERAKENDQWKRKLNQADKKNKEIEKQNNNFMFTLQKQQTKWSMERQNLLEKIKNLQDSVEWEKNKSQLGKSKLEMRKSDSNHYNTDFGKYSWKS